MVETKTSRRGLFALLAALPAAVVGLVSLPAAAKPATRKFATGGVVRQSPAWLIGDGASEFMMPLRRGADGRLGVIHWPVATPTPSGIVWTVTCDGKSPARKVIYDETK